MATFPVPGELLLALFLLPGYVAVRVGLYFARYAGPVDWPEYEKTALSLLGSGILLAGAVVVAPRVVTVTEREGDLLVATEVGVGEYAGVLVAAVVLGAALGQALVTLYERLYGVTRLRVDPEQYLLQRLEPPVPARIVAGHREIVGRVQYTDASGTPVVLHGPRLVAPRDGTEYREKLGTYAYVEPGTIEQVAFGAGFKPESERGGLADRAWRRLRSSAGAVESSPPPDRVERSGPSVTVSEGPLARDEGGVRARGTVRNELPREIRFLQVRVEFEDVDGAILGTGVDSFERLREGDAWRFDVVHATDDPEAVRSFNARWYASPHI